MAQTKITSLIATCKEKMVSDGYSESTIATHLSNLDRGILAYMSERGEEFYHPTSGILSLSVLPEILNGKSIIVASVC